MRRGAGERLEERQGISQDEALTQERQSDCQATCSHSNGKWRVREEETEEERKKYRICFRLKLHCCHEMRV